MPTSDRIVLGAALICGLVLGAGSARALDDVKAPAGDRAAMRMFQDPRQAMSEFLRDYRAGEQSSSIEALRYAADGGESLARWKLGSMYAAGDGVQRDVGLLGPLEARAREKDLASIERQLKDKGDAVEDRQDRVRTKGPQMSALNAEISAEGRLKKNIADNIEARRMARDLAQLRDETRRKK